MELWTVFLTGLLAGGASCAAVQGGLLTGVLARRAPAVAAPARRVVPALTGAPAGRGAGTSVGRSGRKPQHRTAIVASSSGRSPAQPKQRWRDDAAPVTAFLIGKLASHAVLGLLLGALGDAVQLGFRTRTVTQGLAGVVMVLLALHLLGVRRLSFLVPQPPAALSRLVRRSARSQAMAAPAVLGVLTVLIPCGVTLGVAFWPSRRGRRSREY